MESKIDVKEANSQSQLRHHKLHLYRDNVKNVLLKRVHLHFTYGVQLSRDGKASLRWQSKMNITALAKQCHVDTTIINDR